MLGDSIRRSYQPHVARLLAGRAQVQEPRQEYIMGLKEQ